MKKRRKRAIIMAYKVIILYRLYMPSYVLGTFTEYPSFLRNEWDMILFLCSTGSLFQDFPSVPVVSGNLFTDRLQNIPVRNTDYRQILFKICILSGSSCLLIGVPYRFRLSGFRFSGIFLIT